MRRSEAWTNFSQIHLTTPGEWAVFRCFAVSPTRPRSVRDVARSGEIGIREAQEALQRFADAGIVQEAGGVYRWQEAHRYVFGRREPDETLRDPVCGMPVTPGSQFRAHDVFGRIERFCSNRCLASFVVWPVAFTRPRGAPEHRDGGRGEPDDVPAA